LSPRTQKRLDRLQLGGIAQANGGLIGSRPTSAGGPRLAWDAPGSGAGGGLLSSGAGARLASGSGGVSTAPGGAAAGEFPSVQQLPAVSLAGGRATTGSAEEGHFFDRVAPSMEPPLGSTGRWAVLAAQTASAAFAGEELAHASSAQR
jgi:hypothetical protein